MRSGLKRSTATALPGKAAAGRLQSRQKEPSSAWKKRALATRRLYAAEMLLERGAALLPIGALRALAAKVWREREGRGALRIAAGRGAMHAGRRVSECTLYLHPRELVIVLARHERKATVLLHELTHALGHWHHDIKFLQEYFGLLADYAGIDRALLMAALALRQGDKMYYSASSAKSVSGWFETTDGKISRASANFKWAIGEPVLKALQLCKSSGMLVNVGHTAHTCDQSVPLLLLKED